jgi:hypothetical protein
LQDFQIAGTSFKALTTSYTWRHSIIPAERDRRDSKNVKDWMIRSEATFFIKLDISKKKQQKVEES